MRPPASQGAFVAAQGEFATGSDTREFAIGLDAVIAATAALTLLAPLPPESLVCSYGAGYGDRSVDEFDANPATGELYSLPALPGLSEDTLR